MSQWGQFGLSGDTVVLDILRAIAAAQQLGAENVIGLTVNEASVSVRVRQPLPTYFATSAVAILDGTSEEDMYRTLFGPKLEVVDSDMQPMYYRLIQYADRNYGQTMFAAKKHCDSHVAKMWKFVTYHSIVQDTGPDEHGKPRHDVCFIGQKSLCQALAERGLPANVAVHNFGALRGLDHLKHTMCFIVVGQITLNPAEQEELARVFNFDNALGGSVPSLDGFCTTNVHHVMADGRECIVEDVPSHPHEGVRAMQRHFGDNEVAQAVARARLLARTPATAPVIYLFGKAQLGLPVHEFRTWAETEVTDLQLMGGRGIVTSHPRLADAVVPGLVPKTRNARAAWSARVEEELARRLSGFSIIKKREIILGKPVNLEPELCMITVSLIGPGQRPFNVWLSRDSDETRVRRLLESGGLQVKSITISTLALNNAHGNTECSSKSQELSP